MIAFLIACLVLTVGICLMLLVLWRQERRRRRSDQREFDDMIDTAGRLYHAQTPFPYGERLP